MSGEFTVALAERLFGERGALRMRSPRFKSSQRRRTAARGDNRGLQLSCISGFHGCGDASPIRGDVKHAHRGLAMIRVVGVKANPAVSRLVVARDGIPRRRA